MFYSDTFIVRKDFASLILRIVTISVAISACGRELRAEGAGSQIAAVYGFSVADLSSTSPHVLYGAKGSTNIASMLSIGGYIYQTGFAAGSGGQEFDYSLTGIDIAYHMPNGGGDTYFGFRGGITKINTVSGTQELIYSPYHYGVVVGYDYIVGGPFTVGFEGSYLHVEQASDTAGGTTYNEDKFGLINFLVTVGFKF